MMIAKASTKKNTVFFVIAILALIVIYLLPVPDAIEVNQHSIGLTTHGKATLAVLAMAVILWMTEAIPFPVTGLLAIVALVMAKAMPFEELIRDGFGNHIIIFFIGVLIISAAISSTGLFRRLTIWLLFHFGHKPKVILFLTLAVGAALSGWVTDMAVAAILLPIGVSILKDAGAEPRKSNFGRALMIACAWGPLIGGITTPAGCGPNPLTIGFLKSLAGIDFTFIQWMSLGVPAALLMLPCAWFILLKVFPIENINITITEEDKKQKFREIGAIKREEIITTVVFVITIFLWIAAPWIKKLTNNSVDYLSISFVALISSCAFFLPKLNVLTWKQAEQSIDWGGIILVVSGLSLGMAIYKTGAAEWLAWVCFSKIGLFHPVLIIFIVVFGVSLMKVAFSSNTVTGIIIVPLLIALAKNLHLPAELVAIPAGITASLAFLLVTSTPTNVIVYSAGYFSIWDMARAGIWMTIASSICVTISIWLMGTLLQLI